MHNSDRRCSYFLLLSVFCIVSGCSRDFNSQAYYPLHAGYHWRYTGAISDIAVQEEAVNGEKQYIASFQDSLGAVKWKERYVKTSHNVGWIALEPEPSLKISLQFKEAIPLGPISEKVGDEKRIVATESTAGQSPRRMKITYRIAGLEPITVPAGTFPVAVKQTMRIEYPDEPKETPVSENVYWFVRDVGIVKFLWDGEGGELRSAVLGDKKLPL